MAYILGNGTVITLGDNNRIIEGGAVYVDGDTISDIGDTAALKGKYSAAEFIDVHGRVIMPGMINGHMHLYSTFARGMILDGEPAANFTEILDKLWWRLDKKLNNEDIKYSAYIPLIQAIKSGTTTLIDHHASPHAVRGSLNTIADVYKKTGVRGALCYEVSDRDGEKIAREGIEENAEFIKTHQDDAFVKGLFGLHAAFTVSDETLKAAKDSISGIDTGFHIHVAEDASDLQYSLENYGMRVVERLYDRGILGNKTIAAHCIHINEKEMELLAQTKTNVVHNPQSNMNNAVGCADVLKMLDKGVLVGLGTDGMTANMMDEVKVVPLLHKFNKRDPRVAFAEAAELLLKNNVTIANKYFDKKVGVLEQGAYADMIVVDYYPPTPLTGDNFYGHFLFGIASADIDSTIVAGKFLYKNKELLVLDEKQVSAEASKLAAALWKRI